MTVTFEVQSKIPDDPLKIHLESCTNFFRMCFHRFVLFIDFCYAV